MALAVESAFPGGNACAVEIVSSGDRHVVRFAADPHGGTEALWFYFRVEGCDGRQVELVLSNADSCLGAGSQWDATRPVFRQAGGDWERIGRTELRALPDGRHEPAWVVQPTGASFEFAFCYPYGPDDLADTLAVRQGYWREDCIGVSSRGRPLIRLSNSYGGPDASLPGVYLFARQHSGETPGSWVVDGLLRAAAQTLDPTELTVWVVPFANLDGVLDGDYGKDPFPHDLNRAWVIPPMRHEVLVYQRDMRRWATRCRPVLVMDSHAPGATEADGAYFHLPRQSRPPASIAAARVLAETVLAHLPPELTRQQPLKSADYPSRWADNGTVGAFAWDTFGIPCLSMETPYALSRDVVLTRERYRELGTSVLEGILEYMARRE